MLVKKGQCVVREVPVLVVLLAIVAFEVELGIERCYVPGLGTTNEEVHCRVECCIYWNNYCPQDLVVMVF